MPAPGPQQAWVYEVFRMMKGVPLFAEAHLERLQHSTRLAGRKGALPITEINNSLGALADANSVFEGNIKLLLGWNSPQGSVEWAVCFIPHRYPSEADYARGVSLAILEAERLNPNAKVLDAALRKRADEIISSEGVYEVLMVNAKGFITEGSRSNCFFVRSDAIVTPPALQVLPGVTRAMVLDICREAGLPVAEQLVGRNELEAIEAVFLTGTSPGVLPVSHIENRDYPAGHPWVRLIGDAYRGKVNAYLSRRARPEKNQAGE